MQRVVSITPFLRDRERRAADQMDTAKRPRQQKRGKTHTVRVSERLHQVIAIMATNRHAKTHEEIVQAWAEKDPEYPIVVEMLDKRDAMLAAQQAQVDDEVPPTPQVSQE